MSFVFTHFFYIFLVTFPNFWLLRDANLQYFGFSVVIIWPYKIKLHKQSRRHVQIYSTPTLSPLDSN